MSMGCIQDACCRRLTWRAGLATQTLRFGRNRDAGLKPDEDLGGRQRSPTGRPGDLWLPSILAHPPAKGTRGSQYSVTSCTNGPIIISPDGRLPIGREAQGHQCSPKVVKGRHNRLPSRLPRRMACIAQDESSTIAAAQAQGAALYYSRSVSLVHWSSRNDEIACLISRF